MEQWSSAADELTALRTSAAQARCVVRSAAERDTPHGRRAVAHVVCPDGWGAARFLVAQSIADSRTAAARILALELRRASGGSDEAFARAVFDFVKDRVRFVREPGEVFARADYTIASGAGDCDDHARVVYALLRAGGMPARLSFLFRKGDRGPRHVVAQVRLPAGWTWLETTADAEFGEHPYAAARRLGLVDSRQDIASEARHMTENDLSPVPAGFEHRTTAAQFQRDVRALQALGFLCDASAPSSPAEPSFRRAVLQAQRSSSATQDGLIGPQTRKAIGSLLEAVGPEAAAVYLEGLPRSFTHAEAREALRRAYVTLFRREPSAGELDFGLATAYFETFYGRGTGAAWGDGGQFGRWAADGKINWGALQTAAPPGSLDTFEARLLAVGLHPTKERGKDAGRPVYFYLFPSDEEAARAFLIAWGQPDTLAAAATGSATAVSAAMRRHGYYEGFHVAPGKMGGKKSPPFIQEESAEDAERKNVAEYAGALSRHVATVRGAGGVPDLAPSTVATTAVALVLIAGTVAGAWWLAGLPT